MEREFVKVTRVDALHEQRGTLVQVDGEDIALFKRDGVIYALNNVCSHQHFSKLHDGEIREMTVTCPMHGWTYDLRSGKAINGSGRVRTYHVRVKDGDVFLGMKDDSGEFDGND